MVAETLLAQQRAAFHQALVDTQVLTMTSGGVASNADSGQKASIAYARHMARAIGAAPRVKKLAGQTAGKRFEVECAEFLRKTFLKLGHLRPGDWIVEKVQGPKSGVARFEQYSHLSDLDEAVKKDNKLRAILGNDYAISPDVIIARRPEDDEKINVEEPLVDESVAFRPSLRSKYQPLPILHAVVSCKWTLRSDRAQNARSEALNLVRNRKGRLPHITVVTGEPTPARISSLALGTGDIDCVYHFALPELIAAVEAEGADDAVELLATMIDGRRLKDVADLPLDLAV